MPCGAAMLLTFSRLKARQFFGKFSRSIGKDSQLRLVTSGTSQAGLLNLPKNWMKSLAGERLLSGYSILGCRRKSNWLSRM
jgi:hypothetical protein